MNDIYSFYQLISKYQIEIPIIQRDYAQGRNNSKAADVRKSLVDNMIKAVKEDKPLFFDFVYGRVDNNKFIPFDGQQRLTTLFLFHKYVFEKCQSDSGCNHKDNCSCGDILGRFSYATRQSSREFCEKLMQEKIISGNSLTDNIKNQSWFYPDWEKDPTVMGMLTMLDEIHCQMKNETDFKTFAEKLTSGCNCPITFHFVDMGEHKMSDETYVKMNARGKTLTPFENFKASLEQYLEEKNEQELLSRLKGKYDESKQKYTGIDGSWLDLFWEVTNKEKQENEGKELPDSLMMSFFNRHFMNVWRCWYANKTKTEKERNSLNDEQKNEQDEYDAFNKRIQEEMPLYPTKDNFVSFDIYEYVIGKCGVDVCLSPIFNIYDELCGNDNNIENDCQAVWNRSGDSNGEKWDLFQKNVNDETYKSRTAFYALLRYHENSNNGSKPTLEQWMRIVWNIIENYVEREESYIPALQLIETIAENGFDIAKLGDYNGVARDQVKEEIAKAKQILDENGTLRKYNGSCKKKDGSDYQTWEEIIIKAEQYAFFKGAIRFLFTDDGEGNIYWCDFDVKWTNAKKYFDEKGVKDGEEKYRTNASLLKAVLYHVEGFWKYIEPQKYVFDNKAETWKSHILLEDGWKEAVHQILMGNLKISPREGDCLIYKNLYNTNLLNYVSNYLQGSRIRWIHGHRAIYPPYYEGIILDDENRNDKFYRNRLLSSNDSINSEQKIEGLNYYKGWDINFKYKNQIFQWNTDEKVYLLESGKRKQKNESESYCVDVTNLNDSQDLINKLEDLIAQASPE